ncbi:MAG: acyl-CoA reductase [Altibacter sp.]|uniref:acyl-CoA reductase n=1 Tax=Altibacter sp. TaxID=2024823 RepID=UPI001DB0AC4A|nr:acyl-CoA reductase [Altibacter sp.]MBZ0326216.1 acyl-CoA reductase [Altibacter sp.]
MHLQQRINAFTELGRFLGQFGLEHIKKQEGILQNDNFFEGMLQLLDTAEHYNGWFTKKNVQFACKSWYEALSEKNMHRWVSQYTFSETKPKTVAIIMAGNVPLVGFHDFLSVLLTGNKVLVKLSSSDTQLLPFLANYLVAIEPAFKEAISFSEEKLVNFDAVIATGSNNTARYFDYYFGKYPHIIRKNRNSVAILTGSETSEQLEALANDVFRYFGLGCRNVSKIFVPQGYHFDAFFNGMYAWKEIINNNKYINNYDYNKAVYLMSNLDLLDNEFMLLKQDEAYASPIAVLFYEYYRDIETLTEKLRADSDQIQCIVSEDHIQFGAAQSPQLWDYADGVDTVAFLLKLS